MHGDGGESTLREFFRIVIAKFLAADEGCEVFDAFCRFHAGEPSHSKAAGVNGAGFREHTNFAEAARLRTKQDNNVARAFQFGFGGIFGAHIESVLTVFQPASSAAVVSVQLPLLQQMTRSLSMTGTA